MKNFMLMLAIAMVSCGAASAQLNGAYSIDASQPTGGTNYATFAAAAADLTTFGVSGPVTFFVAPNAAPYAGFTIPGLVVGTSSTNTVTFLGGPGVSMAGAAAGFTQVVRLGPTTISTLPAFNGPSYVVIDGFDITVPSTGAGIIMTQSNYCVVQNCYVHGSNTGAGIAIVNSNNCRVEGNEVASTAANPGTPGSATYCGGISCYYTGSGNIITRNKVHDCTNQGIFVGSSGSTTAPSTVTVTNNFVWACPGTGTYPGGIALRRLTGVVANNSVWMTTGMIGGIHQMGAAADPQPATIANNVVKHDGTGGACFKFEGTTTAPATVFDYNLYNPGPGAFVGAVGATNYATIVAWQSVAAPNLSGLELNTLVGDPLYVAGNDLHITPSSPAFNSGLALAAVTTDIDGQSRPLNGIYERGADETQGVGLFAGFSATPVAGAAPLMVAFIDLSFSSSPGGVTGWAWDFQNDGTNDAFIQNPTFTYFCPGVYSVKLTVNDGVNPPSVTIHSNAISVAAQPFAMFTTGGGMGDLFIAPVPASCYPTTVEGFTLISFSSAAPIGTGPFAGLYPDAATVAGIQFPALAGNPLHFVPTPATYPNVPFGTPPGTLSFLFGSTLDAVEILIGPGFQILRITNVARITF